MQELAALVLGELADDPVGITSSDAPSPGALRQRRYAEKKRQQNDAASVSSDVTNDGGADAGSPAPSPLSSSPGLILSFSGSQDLKGSGSSESTGAREGGASRESRESITQRVANSADHQRVIDAFAVAFGRVRGCKPTIGAKGGAGAKALLRGRTVEEAIAIIERAFEDPFVAEKKPDLAYIASNANAYIGRAPTTETRARTAVQPVPATGRVWKVGQ